MATHVNEKSKSPKQINDFWQTLDTSSGAVQSMTAVQLSRYTVAVIIVYLG